MKPAKKVFILGAIALLAACANLWDTPEAPAGKTGTVTLTVGQGYGGERTIYPSLSQFARVILSFDKESGEDVEDVEVEGGAVTLTLPVGRWSVTAKAYVDEEDEDPAAESGARALEYNGTGDVSVADPHFVLEPKPGNGTLKGVVAIPEGTDLGAASRITVTLLGSGAVVYEEQITESLDETANLPAGRYFVDIVLANNADGHTAVYQRTLVIAGGLTTELFFDAAGKFLSPEARAAQTVVDNLVFALAGSNPAGTAIDSEDFETNKSVGILAPNGTAAVYFSVANPDGLALTPKGATLESSGGGVSVFKVDTGSIKDTGGDVPVTITAAEDAMEGIPISVTVSVEPALTADIGFAQTATNSSGLGALSDLTVIDESTQSWTMAAKEKPVVYFAVNKEAGQTISVEEDDEDRVTQVAFGEKLDGSTVGDELAVFAVNAERWDEGTRTSNMFYGTGTHSVAYSPGNVADIQVPLIFEPVTFKLVASEQNRVSKTVEVTVNTATDLTGVAVFKVVDGSLTRVAKEEIRKWKNPESEGNTVIDAMAWIDTGNVPGEYLVRVEADNPIPKTKLSYGENGVVEMRLRGIGEERIIAHNGDPKPAADISEISGYRHSRLSDYKWGNEDGLIELQIVGKEEFYGAEQKGLLALEDKVTLKGLGLNAVLPGAFRDYIYDPLVKINQQGFIMRAGSRLTEYNTNIYGHDMSPVWLLGNGASLYPAAVFLMEGGSIDHNIVARKDDKTVNMGGIVSTPHTLSFIEDSKKNFIKTGGVVVDNVRINTSNQTREEGLAKVRIGSYGELDLSEYER